MGRRGINGQEQGPRVRYGDRRLCWMNVQRNYGPLMVQLKKGRVTATRQLSCRTIQHPPLADQILDNERYGASLQAGDTGQVSPRYRLTRSYEIEHEVAINLPRSLVGRAQLSRKCKGMSWRSGHLGFPAGVTKTTVVQLRLFTSAIAPTSSVFCQMLLHRRRAFISPGDKDL